MIFLDIGRLTRVIGISIVQFHDAAGQVTVSPVRTAGMTPYLTRVIET